jgi:hydrogenase large subunit
MSRTTVAIPLNRVEGDLEIRAELDGGVVVDAWSSGTMFRGFENMLTGRAARDGLVLTPRVCGICTTAHLLAAARALDAIAAVPVTPTGVRVRNAALMVEQIQSDLRQPFLLFAADFAGAAHQEQPLWAEAVRRYRPYEGETVVETIRATKHLLEIVAILGGQWPHSSFIVPGGVVTAPSRADVTRSRQIVATYRAFFERRVLGCSLERWAKVASADDLDAWLDESPAHRDGDLGFFLRFGRAIGLDAIGRGHGRFISFGGLEIPEGSDVPRRARDEAMLLPAAFAHDGEIRPLAQELVAEHVACSWSGDYEGGRHPFDGETRPYASGAEGKKYSWAKAPRYDGAPAETGPLAEAIVGRDPLVTDLVRRSGPTALTRALARIVRPAALLPVLDTWLAELASKPGPCCPADVRIEDGEGAGLVQAARGALGHWVRVERGTIASYQIITPTGWNGSPRDAAGVRGPWEEALVGTPVADPANPVELGYVVRSFDPCLVCTVHAFGDRARRGTLRLRA